MTAHGLHKALGGLRARRRAAWQQLASGTLTCKLPSCPAPAAGFVESALGEWSPVCADHIPRARELGYTVHTDPEGT